MHAEAPPPARSNDRSSGPSSSQPASGVGRGALGRAAEKSGARKGLASCRETTDCGTTRGLVAAAGSSTGGTSSVPVSIPAVRSISRLSDLASSETTASSARSARSAGSRTAVIARVVAMPSRRLSCSARCVSLRVSSARTRARSSRSSSATAWNFVRVAGVTRPLRRAASTSRTVRESTDMTSSRSRPRRRSRGALRRALVWGWPRRATNSSSGMRGTAAVAAAPRTVLRSGDGRRGERPGWLLRDATWPTDLRETAAAGPDSPHTGRRGHRSTVAAPTAMADRGRTSIAQRGSVLPLILPPGDRCGDCGAACSRTA